MRLLDYKQFYGKNRIYLRESGITLIALVITIVILLILAGISIRALSDNGLFGKAKEAKSRNSYSVAYEELSLKITSINLDKQGEATFEDIIKGLNEDEENLYTIYFDSKTSKISNQGDIIEADIGDNSLSDKLENKDEIYIVYKGYEFKINKELSIYNEYSKEIKEEEKQLSLATSEENMVAGNTFTIDSTVAPSGLEIEWTTDKSSVATVEDGVVTAVAQGTANITATIKGTRISETCKITVKKAIAKIDEQYYASLSDAVASVPTTNEQKTITLLSNTSEDIVIASGKNIVYNGGSYTLSGSSTSTTYITINNSGTLTINSGTITNGAYPVHNYGTLNVKGGTICSTSFNAIVNWGTANVTGGKIYNSSGNDRPVWQKGGTLNVSGGTIQTGNTGTIYASGGTTNLSGSNRMINTTSTMPVELGGGTVVGPTIKNLTSTGCEIYMYTNNSNITSVKFPTWTDNNGQDDIIWGSGTSKGSNVFYYKVNASAHNNEKDNYITHIYCYNSSGSTVTTPGGGVGCLAWYSLK